VSNLTYKTRGMSNPRGKSRVYFCCHPDDYSLYFEEVSNEILAKQNCAFWYQQAPDGVLTEQEKDDLAHMQLFVMPVSRRLLQTKNPALEEFAFAVEYHIPVLPLMQERGLEDLFNKTCGDLQFLDKYANDATAISYDEKLDKFLSSTLVGDELAARIRAAFDAYVFLSYRKKDRKYAQELMRLIHKNDFCRDIAIWYDEFLTPGENFNDAILAALKKSDLFVLTVTPNLVNEVNYIMTEEYPAACQEKKPIIPATMVATDPAALAEKYRGLPPCTDAADEVALSRTLLEAVRSLALKENDTSPTHNFFIGLAYLGGVDVEVDHQRALSLIQSAAEAGLEEAVEKLSSMYEKGEGVERNYEQAAKWLEKLAGLAGARYRESQSEADGRRHVQVLKELGKMIFEMGQFARAKVVYGVERKQCGELLERFGDTYYLQEYAFCHVRLGDIASRDGLKEESCGYFEQALTLNMQLAERIDTPEIRYALSQNLERLGNYHRNKNELEKAESYYKRMLEIDENWVKEDPSPRARRALSFSYANVGKLYALKGDLKTALDYEEKALELRKELTEESPDALSYKDLAAIYRHIGSIWKDEKDFAKARVYFLEAVEIGKIAYEKSGSAMQLRSLGIAYTTLADMCRLEGDYTGALDYYRQVAKIEEKVERESGSLRAKRDQSLTLYYMGDCLLRLKRYQAALNELKSAECISREALKDSHALRDAQDVADVLAKIEDVYVAQEDYASALECAKKIADCTRDLLLYGRTKERYALVIRKLYRVVMFAEKCGQKTVELAEDYYGKAVDYAEECIERGIDAEIVSYAVICGAKLAIMLEEARRKKAAVSMYLSTIRIGVHLPEDGGQGSDWRNLAITAKKLYNLRELLREKVDLQSLCDMLKKLSQHFADDEEYNRMLTNVDSKLIGGKHKVQELLLVKKLKNG